MEHDHHGLNCRGPSVETLLAYLADALETPERDEVDTHIDRCAECRRLISVLAETSCLDRGADTTQSPYPAEETTTEAGTHVGRYVLLHPIAAGGMGTVYAAYDPNIDRAVAIKLIRSVRPLDATREAMLMGKLDHPNIVAIHDAGHHDDAVFLAMELVDGGTLRAWFSGSKRPWREIVDVLLDAGAGLVAAHARGVAHLDFKPDNVLVDSRGQVRVADFGLAALWGRRDLPGLAGTPRYMAPEQARGDTGDARTDQFSFCVTLAEALGGTWTRTGRIEIPRRLPRWLRASLQRGMRVQPSERFTSMSALVDRLRGGRARGRRVAGVASAALASTALVVGLRGDSNHADQVPTTASSTIWSPARADRVRAAMAGAFDPADADRVIERVDAYVRAWERADGFDHSAWSEGPKRDGASMCLRRRLIRLDVTLELLETARPEVRVQAPSMLAALPAPATCLDEAAEDATLDAGERDLQRTLIEVDAQLAAGDYDAAAQRLAEVEAQARRSASANLRRLAWGAKAELAGRRGELDDAEQGFSEAARAAAEANSPREVSRAWIRMAQLLAPHEPGRARIALASAEVALVQAQSPPDDAQRGHLHIARGDAARSSSDLETSLEHYTQAHALLEASLGAEHPDTLVALASRAGILPELGRNEEATELLDALLPAAQRVYTAKHPFVATVHYILGVTLQQTAPRESQRHLERALQIRREALPPGHPEVRAVLNSLAQLSRILGDLHAADRYGAEAVQLALDADDLVDAGRCSTSLAAVAAQRGDWRSVLETSEASLRWLGDPPELAFAIFAHHLAASALLKLEQDATRAVEHAEAALSMHQQLAPGRRDRIAHLETLGLALHADGRFARAADTLSELATSAQPDSPKAREATFLALRARFADGDPSVTAPALDAAAHAALQGPGEPSSHARRWLGQND